MKIMKCPKCGRYPKIYECALVRKIRRRMCKCPSYCNVIPYMHGYGNTFGFLFVGNGDDNDIFRNWNMAIGRYIENEKKSWHDTDYSPWTNDVRVNMEVLP